MSEPIAELRYRFQPLHSGRSRNRTAATSPPVGMALPRIARLMALAIKLDDLQHQYPDLAASELARRGRVSRSRITQIFNLRNLAPDIQERLLWLPPQAPGREVVSEKSLRRLAGECDWERQRDAQDCRDSLPPAFSTKAPASPPASPTRSIEMALRKTYDNTSP